MDNVMNIAERKTIKINVSGYDLNYTFADNTHMLSADKRSPVMGLCVFAKDYDEALVEAQEQIKDLIEHNKI